MRKVVKYLSFDMIQAAVGMSADPPDPYENLRNWQDSQLTTIHFSVNRAWCSADIPGSYIYIINSQAKSFFLTAIILQNFCKFSKNKDFAIIFLRHFMVIRIVVISLNMINSFDIKKLFSQKNFNLRYSQHRETTTDKRTTDKKYLQFFLIFVTTRQGGGAERVGVS